MNNYERIKNKSIEEMTTFLKDELDYDCDKIYKWFELHYCEKCKHKLPDDGTYFCEFDFEEDCPYVSNTTDRNSAIIKLWLESEVD